MKEKMDFEHGERIVQIRNALTLLWNCHIDEFTFYEGKCINDAYWALVDVFDKKRAEEFKNASKQVKDYIKREMKKKKI